MMISQNYLAIVYTQRHSLLAAWHSCQMATMTGIDSHCTRPPGLVNLWPGNFTMISIVDITPCETMTSIDQAVHKS